MIMNIEILVKNLNEMFCDTNYTIKNMLCTENINTREKKLSFLDAIEYKFISSYIHNTNLFASSIINYKNENENVNISNYYRKEQKIPVSFYKNVLNKFQIFFDKYNQNNFNYKLIAVDGTYNNTNFKNDKLLETTLNMGFYDITNEIPIDIVLKTYLDKNKEIEALVSYINENKINTKNIIIVADRAYYSLELFKFLNTKKIKFVIRVKNNCTHLKNNDIKDIRFVKYSTDIKLKVKDKNNEDVLISKKLLCNMSTNLDDTFTDEHIKNIYKSRWDVEVFFKLIKSNFKFSYLTNHNDKIVDCYLKTYIIILINSLLVKLIIMLKNNIVDNNKYSVKYNKTLIIKGIETLISDIIHSSVTYDKLKKISKCFLIKSYSLKNKSNPRTSKKPFTKWYVKSYSDFYKNAKMIECIRSKKLNDLNKNLKMEALTITII